jgi:hypothetical protein
LWQHCTRHYCDTAATCTTVALVFNLAINSHLCDRMRRVELLSCKYTSTVAVHCQVSNSYCVTEPLLLSVNSRDDVLLCCNLINNVNTRFFVIVVTKNRIIGKMILCIIIGSILAMVYWTRVRFIRNSRKCCLIIKLLCIAY